MKINSSVQSVVDREKKKTEKKERLWSLVFAFFFFC